MTGKVTDFDLEGMKAIMEMLPMKTAYAMNEEEAEKIKKEMEAKGLQLAAISNAGLKEGIRMTFLPDSAFTNTDTSKRSGEGWPHTNKVSVEVREWVKDLDKGAK